MPADPRLLADLSDAVGPAHVVRPGSPMDAYERDWTGRYRGFAAAVVRPCSTAEVAAVVEACRRHGASLLPQGGFTGLAGVVPRDDVVVHLGRLRAPVEVDPVAGQAVATAGVTIEAVQAAARVHGLDYGIDLASRGSATVGGTIATNAGGLRVVRHGDTRAQVIGVQAVLGTSETITRMSALTRDNTGYHLPSLLTGSEGTLGVVTAARLRLVRPAPRRVLGMLAFASVDEAVVAAQVLRRDVPGVEAVELVLREGVELVRSVAGLPAPLPGTDAVAYVLVEVGGVGGDLADLLAEAAASLEGLLDAAVAADAAGRERLWAYRERHTEAINTVGAPLKLDVTLPAAAYASFCADVPGLVDALVPGARVWLFGHVGDGNAHVNVTGVPTERGEAVTDAVLRLVASLDGSIATEHGIGRAKKRWLGLARSPEELALFARVKQAFDPDGILAPGVLLG
ncbi:MAG: FAD-binding oxidoreductase [Kineosporiaceae bacterium]